MMGIYFNSMYSTGTIYEHTIYIILLLLLHDPILICTYCYMVRVCVFMYGPVTESRWVMLISGRVFVFRTQTPGFTPQIG